MTECFEFSIIIDIFNCQSFLVETIESIINQSINFKEKTEIIFTCQDSDEDSMKIIESYQNEYSENIHILNHSPSKTDIHGNYVTFLDIGNAYSKTFLKRVSDSFKNQDSEICYADDLDCREIDFERDDEVIDFNLSNLFIKSDLIDNFFFKNYFDKKLLVYKLLLENPKMSIVFEDSVFENPHEITDSDLLASFDDFFKVLIDLSCEKYGEVPLFMQRFLILELEKFLRIEDISQVTPNKNEFMCKFKGILNHISDDAIINHPLLKRSIKSFFIYLKRGDFKIDGVLLKSKDYIINDLSKLKLRIDFVELLDDELNFTASITSSSYPDDLSVYAVQTFKDTEILHKAKYEYYPTSPRRDKRYLDIDWEFSYQFYVSIPLNDEEFELNFKTVFNNQEFSNHIIFREFAGLSNSGNYTVKNSRILLFKGRTFYLEKYSYFKMCKYELKSMARIILSHNDFFVKAIFYRLIYLILYPFFKDKRIWLFSDRIESADDNAEYLFNYCLGQNDNVKKYFVLDKSSTDFKRFKDNIVHFTSIKHKILYLFSEKIITSQVTRGILNPFTFNNSRLYEGVSNYEWCFIQHGIILHDLSSWIHKYNKNFYLFVTSSDYERDSIINGNYNYPADRVKTFGLSRYDFLEDNPKKQILFAPTWRRNLNTRVDLVNSQYLESINSLLNNEKLISYAEDKGYELIFKPHPDLWKFIDLFDSKFKISKDSYSDVFKTASLMITDYSSVAFDFAYLKKPIVYYQTESFDKFHYDKGYFDYDEMGFGEVMSTEEDLVEKIVEYMDNGCCMSDKYRNRVDKFFKFRDKNNSKRIYDFLIYK